MLYFKVDEKYVYKHNKKLTYFFMKFFEASEHFSLTSPFLQKLQGLTAIFSYFPCLFWKSFETHNYIFIQQLSRLTFYLKMS